MFKIYIVALAFLAPVTVGEAFSPVKLQEEESSWKLSKEKNGIKVYTRKSAETAVKEFRAVRTLKNTRLASIVALLKDISFIPKWYPDIISAKKLRSSGNKEWTSNIVLDVPWPFENRDLVLDYKLSQDPATKVVTIKMQSNPTFIEEKEDIVRIVHAEGFWQFTPKPGGEIEVVQEFVADPAGSIPAWVTNMFIVDGPVTTFTNLEEMVKKPEYADAKLEYIEG